MRITACVVVKKLCLYPVYRSRHGECRRCGGGGAGGGSTSSSVGNGAPGGILITYVTGGLSISGVITTAAGTPVPGVTVTLTGDNFQTTATNNSGNYAFTVAQGGNYTVTPFKNNDVATSNGISSLDILLTRRHILGTPFSTPYKIIAADVDTSGSVSTLDILLTQLMILQNTTTFPGSRLWSFVPHDHVFADPVNLFPYPTSRTFTNVQQSLANENFFGIKLGDVNDSWDVNIP